MLCLPLPLDAIPNYAFALLCQSKLCHCPSLRVSAIAIHRNAKPIPAAPLLCCALLYSAGPLQFVAEQCPAPL